VPVLVDASNSLPPRENLHKFIDMGADLVCFSGGKGLQGPQGAGILAGRADLIESVSMQSAPSHGIGRVAKVSKEEIVGQIASFKWWADQDDEDRMTEHHRLSQLLVNQISDLPNCEIEVVFPDYSQRPYPTVHVTALAESGLDGASLRKELHGGDPAIAVMNDGRDPRTVRIDVRLLEEDEIAAIAKRLHEIFAAAG
jgi:L-seryl-tRNA(Ser) seleniumtransferase